MYDLAIIGAGWAGFNAALRGRSLGLKVALIEKGEIGGTCLNRGCIPTKTLIQSAKVYSLIRKSKTFAVSLPGEPAVDFIGIQARKEQVIAQLRRGMESQLSGIDVVRGEACFKDGESVIVDGKSLQARFFLVASGSKPFELPGLAFGRNIVSSDGLLSVQAVPSSLLIVGGGVIGCEFASLFSALGTRVTVAELMPQLLPGMDRDVARKLENVYKKKGIQVLTGADATKLDTSSYGMVLVSVGRKAGINGLELEKAGVRVEKDRIVTDEFLNAGNPRVYAAGDCTARLMLAHYAGHQGRQAVDNMFCPGSLRRVSDSHIPSCVFTDPEIGTIGLHEEEARRRGLAVEVRRFDFLASGMARVLDEADGFIKIVSDAKSERILGASIIGPKATELIGILTAAVHSGMTISGLRETVFAHPTLSEALGEAAALNPLKNGS